MRGIAAREDRRGKVLDGKPRPVEGNWSGLSNKAAARDDPPPCRFNAVAVGLFRPKSASF